MKIDSILDMGLGGEGKTSKNMKQKLVVFQGPKGLQSTRNGFYWSSY